MYRNNHRCIPKPDIQDIIRSLSPSDAANSTFRTFFFMPGALTVNRNENILIRWYNTPPKYHVGHLRILCHSHNYIGYEPKYGWYRR